MVQHIVMWNLKEGIDKAAAAAEMKKRLEALVGQVPGLLEAHVCAAFGGYDVALVSRHEDREALEVYQNHPAHVEVKGYVHTVAAERVFSDGEL